MFVLHIDWGVRNRDRGLPIRIHDRRMLSHRVKIIPANEDEYRGKNFLDQYRDQSDEYSLLVSKYWFDKHRLRTVHHRLRNTILPDILNTIIVCEMFDPALFLGKRTQSRI